MIPERGTLFERRYENQLAALCAVTYEALAFLEEQGADARATYLARVA
jgi:hypothetical protein